MDVVQIVDLDRYPIHEAGGAGFEAAVAAACAGLAHDGCAVLRDFVQPRALAQMADESRRLKLMTAAINRPWVPYPPYHIPEGESWPQGHPRVHHTNRCNRFVCYDMLAPDPAVRTLYESPMMSELVRRCAGAERLYPYGDPLGACVLSIQEAGEELPWHFDLTHFVVSLLIQEPEGGGKFQYAPASRRKSGQMTAVELVDALRKHDRWVRNLKGGSRAMLAYADLSGLRLRGINLGGAVLTGANLANTDLSGCDLGDADLYAANLSNACLREANFEAADLRGAKLNNADFSGANLHKADLRQGALMVGSESEGLTTPDSGRMSESRRSRPAELTDANLSNAMLSRANLAGAILRGADLKGANLEDANLASVDLKGANLDNASIVGTNLRGAMLEGAQFERSVENLRQDLRDILDTHRLWVASMGARGARAALDGEDFGYVAFNGLDLSGDSFRGGRFVGANFNDCNLALTDFSEADLQGAKLRSACLQGARLRGALLTRADLSNADLTPMKLRGRDGRLTGAEVAADLSGADLEDAFLEGVDLEQASL
jgi:uncharacterized protein YjbI with pentapeptide repeats